MMKSPYERKETYPVDQVLPYVVFSIKKISRNDKFSDSPLKEYDGDLINMSSFRYQLFAKKGCVCVSCGLVGTFFAKEKFKNETNYHFNLYGITPEGNEMMLTKDHIYPKSKGGKDHLDNFQTMCSKCNEEKGAKVEGEDQ